jgi:hypothetical protein
MDEHRRLADQLEAVLAGTVDLHAVLDNAASFGEPMESCFHGLCHYRDDADIRDRDSAYRSMQDGEMRKLIQLLRAGATPAILARVSFLRVS